MAEAVTREGDFVDSPAPVAAKSRRKHAGGRPKGARTKNIDPTIALQSPEVQKVIAKAVEAATADLVAKLAAARAQHGTEGGADDNDWSRRLALSIAELSDQGQNRRRVPPEVLEKRGQAFERMMALIMDFRAQDIMPEYELTRPVYLNEELVPPTYTDRDHVMRQTKIEWFDVPNEGMRPANPSAKAIFGEFMQWIGGPTTNVVRLTDKIGEQKPHTGLKVLHKDETATTSPVAIRRNAGVTKLGRRQAGDVIETQVLGSIAEPARQIA